MYQKFYPLLAGNHSLFNGLTFMPARHLPAHALQWQVGRSRSGPARFTRLTSGGQVAGREAGGPATWNNEVLGTKN